MAYIPACVAPFWLGYSSIPLVSSHSVCVYYKESNISCFPSSFSSSITIFYHLLLVVTNIPRSCPHSTFASPVCFAIMDWTPESFPPSSHQARSLSGNPMVFDAIPPAYPSGRPNYPPVTGLGISHGEVDVPLGQLRLCPPPDVYTTTAATATLPTAGWSDGILPHSVDHSYYSSTTPYEPYSAGHNDISPSPLSLYSAQTLSTSPSYSSVMEMGETHGLPGQQPLGFWATTPCSDSTSPPESFAQVKEESDEYWGSPLFAEERAPIELSMMSMPRVMVNEPFCDAQLFQTGNGQQFGPVASIKQEVQKPPHVAKPATNEGTGKKTPKTRPKTKRSAKSPSASIHQCTICETRFTRRSNCIEHIKKHNPDTKKAYPCDLCGRTFGRKTDRKRHVESVSLHKPESS